MASGAEIEKKEKGFVSHVFTWVAVGFAVVATYVLSEGPALRYLYGHGWTSSLMIEKFYDPLEKARAQNRFVYRFTDWYIDDVWDMRTPPCHGTRRAQP